MKAEKSKTKKARGIYLLPNLFTTAALFAGFYAIVAAMRSDFDHAAIAIFYCLIADSLDGRVARLISAQSDFGAEYDSLSDMVSFGVAPALMLYAWSLQALGKMGWLVAFIYTATVALRLARFNTQIGVADKRYFQGLPCPTAAAVLAGFVWLGAQWGIDGESLRFVLAPVIIGLASLMVSNVRYHSFKELDFKGRVPFITILLVVLVFVGIAIYPALMLTLIFSAYVLSGPIFTLWRLRQKRGERLRK